MLVVDEQEDYFAPDACSVVKSPDGKIKIKIILKPQIVIRPEKFAPPEQPAVAAPPLQQPIAAPTPQQPVAGGGEEAAIGEALQQLAQVLAPPSAVQTTAAPVCAQIANVLYTPPSADRNELALLRDACKVAGLSCGALDNCSNAAAIPVLTTLTSTITPETPNCREILQNAISSLTCVAAPTTAPAPIATPAAPVAEALIESSDVPEITPAGVDLLTRIGAKKKNLDVIKRNYAAIALAIDGQITPLCYKADIDKTQLKFEALNNVWSGIGNVKPEEIDWAMLTTRAINYVDDACKAAGREILRQTSFMGGAVKTSAPIEREDVLSPSVVSEAEFQILRANDVRKDDVKLFNDQYRLFLQLVESRISLSCTKAEGRNIRGQIYDRVVDLTWKNIRELGRSPTATEWIRFQEEATSTIDDLCTRAGGETFVTTNISGKK